MSSPDAPEPEAVGPNQTVADPAQATTSSGLLAAADEGAPAESGATESADQLGGLAPLQTTQLDRLAAALDGGGLGGEAAAGELTLGSGGANSAVLPPFIGGYRIVGLLGEGGMGVVYQAEQQNPRRPVALKVIRPLAGGRGMMRRFRLEAETLGRLEHPGIARIYEAGAAPIAGGVRPFFAMELVRGLPLGRYADARGLVTRQRLELLARVCDAVHYAHQKGVIHRDLKPGNILVTGDGQPKVLDFGVARVVDADGAALTAPAGFTGMAGTLGTAETASGAVVGTLRYMSPEQADGRSRDVDTRSDVYALGVIGYELLTGRLPYDLDAQPLAEVLRLIREADPPPPSTLDRTLRGDVETILLKAMEKERHRRYASAAELAADMRRFLACEPIAARPPSTAYQLSRFARRNKVLVGGVAAVFVAVVTGLVATTFQAVRATNAERTTKQEQIKTLAEKNTAVRERERAEGQRVRADRRTAEQLIAAGFKDLEGGDPSLALLEFVRALRIDEVDAPDAGRAAADRYRIGMALPRVPRPIDADYPVPEGVFPAGNLVWQPDEPTELSVRQLGTDRVVGRIHTDVPLSFAALSPDGHCLATVVGQDVKFWDVETGRATGVTVRPPDADRYYQALVFSPDSRRLATLTEYAEVWDVKTGAALTPRLPHRRQTNDVVFSPDSRRLATAGNDGVARLWDLDGGPRPYGAAHLVRQFQHGAVAVLKVAFAGEGARKLLTCSAPDNAVRVWDTETGRLLAGPLSHEAYPAMVALSPDESHLVTATRDTRTARVWDLRTGRPLCGSMRHAEGIVDMRFVAADPRLVLTLPAWTQTAAPYSTSVWDTADGLPGMVVRHPGGVYSGEFSLDGSRILTTGDDKAARVWDAATGREISLPMRRDYWGPEDASGAPEINQAVLSPDGRRVALAAHGVSGSVRVWDAASGIPISRLEKDARDTPTVSFSPDSRLLVSSNGRDKEAWVWKAESGALIGPALVHDAPCVGAQFSPDGRVIATVATPAFPSPYDGTVFWVHLWDAETRRRLTPAPIGPALRMLNYAVEAVPEVSFSPDGRLVATAANVPAAFPIPDESPRTPATFPANIPIGAADWRVLIQVWDARTGRRVAPPINLALKDAYGVIRVAFSPDGRRLLTCGPDTAAWVWDVASGRAVGRPLAHPSEVWHAAFSPDGRLVATASEDKTARVWDVATGLPVSAPLTHRQAVYRVAFSPDGTRLLSCGGDGSARVWDVVPDVRPLADLERLAELLSGRRLDNAGASIALSTEDGRRAWNDLRHKYPQQFKPPAPPRPAPTEPLPGYAQGLAAMPWHPWRVTELAVSEVFAGNGAEAVAAARKALETPPQSPQLVYMTLAEGYLLAGRFEQAKAILLEHRDEPYPGEPRNFMGDLTEPESWHKPTFGETALQDFDRLRDSGIDCPDLRRAERLLRDRPPTSGPTTLP